MSYLINPSANTCLTSTYGNPIILDKSWFYEALLDTHNVIEKIMHEIPVDIFSILGMRGIFAFISELYVVSLVNNHLNNGCFIKNPHQDGYPDLLLMDDNGRNIYQQIANAVQLRHKAPFSPFDNGGLEIKATFGDVPAPDECLKKWGVEKPDMGVTRIDYLTGYKWQAHHKGTNNLVGVLLDFQNQVPIIAAVFFGNNLTTSDWGKIAEYKEDGGNSTSVTGMLVSGIEKMNKNWLVVKNDIRYINKINRYEQNIMF